MESEAQRIGSSILTLPPLQNFDGSQFSSFVLGADGGNNTMNGPYERNAAMSLLLSRYYYEYHRSKNLPKTDAPAMSQAPGFKLQREEIMGLKLLKWPGRNQIIHHQNATYFLDGAHTPVSIEHCANWFAKVSVDKLPGLFRILLFAKSRGRDGESFLRTLASAGKFDLIIISGSWQSNFQVLIN